MESFLKWGGFAQVSIHWMDLSLIVLYLVGILAFGYFYGKRVSSSADYFLGGRSLPWWIIGMSIIGSNIGSNDYVGASGGAYAIGIAQANFEWIGAIPAMILSAFIFIPFYWRAGVFSIPEYLGLRYGSQVRVLSAGVLSLFSLFIVAVFLWATALMLKTYLGLPIWFSILVTAVVVGFYTISGGLAAVAITDVVQLFIMFGGAFLMMVLGISKVGGLGTFITRLETEFPGHLNAFLPSTHPDFPWPGVILGLGLVLSPAYWCTNQVILQRTMAAKSRWDGQASMIFAAIAKSFVPFLIVFPGFLALLLYTGKLGNQDQALPWIIRNILPPGLSGLIFVSFIAALQSSVDSTLNSTSVMVTRDIIGVLRGGPVDDARELKTGKLITFLALFLGVILAPVVSPKGIYGFIQTLLAFFQGPLFALMLIGILTRRITKAAGLSGFLAGIAFAALLKVLGVGMLYVAFWSFVFTVVWLYLVSMFTRPSRDDELRNLTFATTEFSSAEEQAQEKKEV